MSTQDYATKWMLLDPRRGFIERFLRYKWRLGDRLPVSWQEAVDWLSEFDAKRNEANIYFEKMFYEHMATCIHPIIVPKDFADLLKANGAKEAPAPAASKPEAAKP